MKHILFYTDVEGIGGHEIMALEIVRALAAEGPYRLSMAISANNTRLRDALATLPSVETVYLPFSSLKRDYSRSPFSSRRRKFVEQMVDRCAPDVIVSVQPRIELCTLIAHVARRRHVPVVSYVPFAHPPNPAAEGWLKAILRKLVLRHLYKLFDGFVTITGSAKRDILSQNPAAKVEIVDNVVRFEPRATPRAAARSALDLPQDSVILGIVGRIDFAQKGQDLSVDLFGEYRPTETTKLLIVGSGEPDATRLREMIARSEYRSDILLRDWTNDVQVIFAAIDCLLVASRMEGMPLVMLEALLSGTPVVASDCDGMQEVLPPEWRFDRTKPAEIRRAIERALADDSRSTLSSVQSDVRHRFSRDDLGTRFAAALESLGRRQSLQ